MNITPRTTTQSTTDIASSGDESDHPQPLLDGSVLRSDDGRAEEMQIKKSAKSAEEAKPPTFFRLLAPGSAAINDSSLILDAGSGNALRLIAFSVTAYIALNAAVFALTPTTLALSDDEHTAVVLTLCLQVASLLHDALARSRISSSERDTHLCIVVVKLLAALTNALLCFMRETPFVLDMVTGRNNSMLRWAEWVVLAFTITFIVEAVDTTNVRYPRTARARGLSRRQPPTLTVTAATHSECAVRALSGRRASPCSSVPRSPSRPSAVSSSHSRAPSHSRGPCCSPSPLASSSSSSGASPPSRPSSSSCAAASTKEPTPSSVTRTQSEALSD